MRVEGAPEPAEEPESAEQEADPCASLEIASVGGSVSNGYALWVWKGSPVDDGVCWVDFKLSYSDDYGATFTEAAVVRRGMGAVPRGCRVHSPSGCIGRAWSVGSGELPSLHIAAHERGPRIPKGRDIWGYKKGVVRLDELWGKMWGNFTEAPNS